MKPAQEHAINPAGATSDAANDNAIPGEASSGATDSDGSPLDAQQQEPPEPIDVPTMFRSAFQTPYLTCSRCNRVTFIDVRRIRTSSSSTTTAPVTSAADLASFEQVPKCCGCGTTKYMRAGLVSFEEKIADEQRAIKEFERKRGPATALLQRIARGFLGRLRFRRCKEEQQRHQRMLHRAATRLQAWIRGLQACRRAILERCLRVIHDLHPSLLHFAIAPRGDRAPVFWYESPKELQVLFWNYREFVRRLGGKPSLIQVEANILEITRRMLQREFELVSRIQARWRALTTRRVFEEFKRQQGWLRGMQQSPAIRVQRVYRAHCAMRRCRQLRARNRFPVLRHAYREDMQLQQRRQQTREWRAALLAKYRSAYQRHKMSKMLAMDAPDPERSNDGMDAITVKSVTHSLQQHINAALEIEDAPHAHPNARRLMDLQRRMRKMHGGPRVRILHARAFAESEHAARVGAD